MMRAAALRRDLHVPTGTAAAITVVAAASLAALAVWGASPAGRYLEHDPALAATDPMPVTLGAFALAWLLMTTATMLPTATPLVGAFAQLTSRRDDRTALVWSLIAGFTLVWAFAGVVAAVGDVAAHWVVEHTSLHHHPQALAANGLALAGLYQLSGLSARCARACRSPMSFFARHWTGRADVNRQALRAGAAYGVSCLGCCAALMVVMLGVGMGNVGWMLALGVLAAAQKHSPFADALRIAIGIALVVAAIAIAGTAA